MKKKSLVIMVCILFGLMISYGVVSASDDPNVTGHLFRVAEGEDITEITVKNGYGTFEFRPDGEEWIVSDGDGEYRAHPEKMELILSALKDFTISRTLETESAQYGLNNPYAAVSFKTDRGGGHGFLVGNTTVSANDNYVKDDKTIAVTAGANVAQFDGSLTAYRDKNVFTVDAANLEQIGYYQNGELAISLQKSEDGWTIIYPFEAPARSILMREFTEQLQGWTIAGFPDPEAVTTEEMGLNETSEALMLIDAEGNEQVLEFGTESGTARFVRTGGEDDVAMLYTADVDLASMQPETMMIVSPLRTTVDLVESMDINIGGDNYHIEVNDAAQTASINGRLVDYESFIAVFYKYITLRAVGRDDTGTAQGEETGSMTTVYNDGSTASLVLLQRDDDTYFMQIDDEAVYYMPKSQIEDLQTRIETVLGQ